MIPGESQKGSLLSGVLLIAGTCIGAGMLAMPAVTGAMGFFPALALNVLCWFYMLCTGLLFLEATLWMHDGANVTSMTERFLGQPGKWIGASTFIFLYFCLLIGYIAAGTPLLVSFFDLTFLQGFPGYLVFASIFGLIVFIGASMIDRVNVILMISLVFSYFALIWSGSSEVTAENLDRQSWWLMIYGAPTLFSAYGYQNVIPSISTYLRRDAKTLRMAIMIGTMIPLVLYILWQWMILGALTEEALRTSLERGEPVTFALSSLEQMTGNAFLPIFAKFFSFFAIITSVLGVAFSCVDFLGDGLSIRRTGWPRLGLCVITFGIPMMLAYIYPWIFIKAMGYAGGFGEAALNGFIPVAMVWVGRYRMGLSSQIALPGGKPMLILLFLFGVAITGVEVLELLK
jgi:tyrosine-specific transport protein